MVTPLVTRAHWDAMVDRGELEGMHVELLEGRVVEVSPQGPEHGCMIVALTQLLGPEGDLAVQLPLAASGLSEPEPDLALAGPRTPAGHPTTAELVVEVVVTQRAQAERKKRVYAQAVIPAYWIVDVPRRTVEVLTDPWGLGYGTSRVLSGDDALHGTMTVAGLFASAGFRD